MWAFWRREWWGNGAYSRPAKPAETFGLKKRLLTLSMAKPKQTADAVFITYELFVYGDITLLCQNALKIANYILL